MAANEKIEFTIPRAKALEVINSGGSVLFRGTIYSKGNVEKMPGESEWAKGNPEAERAARETLEARLRDTQAELDKFKEKK